MRRTAQITFVGSGTLPTPSGQASLTASDVIDRFDPDAFAQTIGRVVPMRTGPGDRRAGCVSPPPTWLRMGRA
jgi:hypothetical protein